METKVSRVLVVDDNEESLCLMEALLRGVGHEVAAARNGAEALEKLQAQDFDIIVTDILMPVMDGFQLCMHVKQDDRLRGIPLVFYTATYTDEHDADLALAMGAYKFIRKPVEPGELARIINEVVAEVSEGKIRTGDTPWEKQEVLFQRYNERVVNKLVQKTRELEQEIAQRKQAQEALQESEEKYRTLFEESFDGLFVTSPGGRILDMNKKGVAMFGYDTKEEILSLDLERDVYTHPSDRKRILAMVDAQGSAEYEVVVKKKSGEEMITHCALTAVKDEKGVITSCRGIIRDITHRKRAEEALRDSEEKFRLIVEGSPDAIFVQTGGLFAYLNREALRLFGADSVGDLLGKPVMDRFHPRFREAISERIRLLRDEKKPVPSLEEIYLRMDGSEVSVDVSAVPVRFEGQDGALVFVRDITDRKLAEEALRTSEAELSNAVMIARLGRWEYDVTKDLFTFNDHFYKLFRTTAEQVGGYTMSSAEYARRFVHPDDMSVIGNEIRKSIEATDPNFSQQLEHRIVYADGEIGHISVRIFLVKDELGRTVRTFGVNQDITDRKRAEEALQASGAYNRSLIEASLDPLVTISAEGKITDVNAATEKVTGYSRGELIGTDFADYFSDPARAREGYQRAFNEGVVKDYELEIRRRDGHLTSVMYNAAVYKDRFGGVAGLFAAARDISQRKRAEESLIRSEERYRSLVENIYLGITLIDPDFSIRMVNTTFAKWFDKPVSEFSGKQCFREFEKREAVCSHCPGVRTMSTGQPAEVETQGVRDDGTRFDVRLRTFPILGQDGVATGFIEVVEDITEHKRMEDALRESERRYRTLFEESIDGVYSVLRDGEITDANPSFCELFGYTREEMIGKDIRELYVDPADRPKFQKEIERKGFVKDYEVNWKKKDGTEVDCLLTSSVFLGKDGSIAGYKGIARDLTAQKELERQLLQAQKMEAIGTLAGGIAHDFNNLLTVILGYSELIASEKEEGDREYEDLSKVIHAARSAEDMVQQILAFSRKTETRPRPINLNKQIEQLRKMLSRLIPKTIEIEINLDSDLPIVNADPAQIEQVLMNLAVNARDAMPEGGNLIIESRTVFLDHEYCHSHLEAAYGRHALLVVRDTGIGMDRRRMDRIFEPFFTTKKPGEGTGLGLAIVYGIVKGHGGHITCDSEPGKGATFKIYLPAHEAEEAADVATSQTFSAFGTGTILLVDDEAMVRSLGQRILERMGYDVITAENGREAVEIYRERNDQLSLVILDLMMPVMDGYRCFQEILRIDPGAKVLIATGYAPDKATEQTLQIQSSGFVRKPFNVRELLQAVRKALAED